MFEYETEKSIDAPPGEVWKHLVDFDRHGEWSQHFRLRGQAVAGTDGHVEFTLFGKASDAPVVIQEVDEGRELRWEGGPKGIVTGNHYFLLEPRDGGKRTRFVHGEKFSGLLAPLLWPVLKAQLGPAYAGFNEDLKRRVEGA